MSLSVGDTAPVFTLPEAPGSLVEVDASKAGAPIVVLFFPLAFSGVCTEAFCTIRDDWNAWTGLGANVYGVSIDSPFTNAKFREVENLPFPLLSDFNKTVAAEWGALHDDLMGLKGVAKRAAFVIGADGKARTRISDTIVAFKRLSQAEIDWYVACGEGMGKAGGYAIQGKAEAFVRYLAGSHSGVVGLPVFETRALLESAGYGLG